MQNNTHFPTTLQNNLPEESVDIRQLLFKILRHWPWITLSLIIAVTIAWLYNRYAEPMYKATASIMIKDEKKGGGGLLDNPLLKELDLGGGGKLVDNEIEVLKSYDLMEDVVRKEQLFLDIKSKGSLTTRSVFDKEAPVIIRIANPDTITQALQWGLARELNGKWHLDYGARNKNLPVTRGRWYSINGLLLQITDNPAFKANTDSTNLADDYLIYIKPVKAAVDNYSTALKVQPASKTATIINMELTNHNNRRAQTSLNALIDIYNQQALEDKNKVTNNTLEFLNDRLAIIENELRSVEGQVERFKSSNRITDVSVEAQQYMEQAKQVDIQKAEQQTQLSILESLESNLKANQDNPKLVPSGSGIAEPSLAEMIQTHNRLVLERERQAERLGPKNPIPVDLANQIANLRVSLITNIGNLKQAYRIALHDVTRKDAELNARIRNIPQIQKNLVQIQRDQSVKEQLYFLLLQKREESAITLASTIPDSRSIEKPRSAGIVSPKKVLILTIAFLLGLIIPIGIIYIINFFNNKIEDKDEVEQNCKLPVLGEISYVKKDTSPIVVQKGSRSIVAEQFRGIRTNISFTKPGHSPRVLLVTSHRPEEGKSFTSLNLAASYALLNKKVVVLEFDLRKPRLSAALNIHSEVGISNYLAGSTAAIDDILHEVTGFEQRFWLLPAGPIPPNPAELILGERMKNLMEELNKKFDYIIFDTPPYGPVTDSSLLAAHTDISIVVLRQGFTFKWVLQELNKKITNNPTQLLYIVINRVGEKNRYGNYKNYGYGYTEYFDAPQKKKKWWQR
ncbi:polysaccharide biosynthesis tyrosine autokinase [Agriterribacter sp.]|uniref:GumC family protein n=1 Tax=Agriterribacter sp. TaxID=2821509 RepID=UPI002C7E8B25|nr:polysaccharide biosynthesis tyrosine autokinase [Agriterribacter sp.]HRO47701.1 polysaccharide biosynthesis tyrosine autokinase [Agriterribacter sp.]HRQ18084.1 polysaccharide biosynthesis tyrosine autokinase [Agriterribacter sp.]